MAWPAKQKPKELARQMALEGYTPKEIVMAVGLSRPTVDAVRRELGMIKPRTPSELVEFKCQQCGKSFKRKRTDQEMRNRQRQRVSGSNAETFCSMKCYRRFQQWSPEDERYLRENFGKLTNRQIAKNLGRAACTLSEKARQIGLKHFDMWTDEQVAEVLEMRKTLTIPEVAALLGRTKQAVRGVLQYRGLEKKQRGYATHCRWCGCSRDESCRRVFCRDLCHRCYAYLRENHFDEELALADVTLRDLLKEIRRERGSS